MWIRTFQFGSLVHRCLLHCQTRPLSDTFCMCVREGEEKRIYKFMQIRQLWGQANGVWAHDLLLAVNTTMWSAWKSNTGSCGVPHTMNTCCGATLRNLDGTSRNIPKPRPFFRSAGFNPEVFSAFGKILPKKQVPCITTAAVLWQTRPIFLDSPKDGSKRCCVGILVRCSSHGCRLPKEWSTQWKTYSPLSGNSLDQQAAAVSAPPPSCNGRKKLRVYNYIYIVL